MHLDKKNAAPVVETGSGAGEQIALAGVLLSENDSTTGRVLAQEISPLLLAGEENAVPLQYLMKITGWEARMVRQVIQRERLTSRLTMRSAAGGSSPCCTGRRRLQKRPALWRRGRKNEREAGDHVVFLRLDADAGPG